MSITPSETPSITLLHHHAPNHRQFPPRWRTYTLFSPPNHIIFLIPHLWFVDLRKRILSLLFDFRKHKSGVKVFLAHKLFMFPGSASSSHVISAQGGRTFLRAFFWAATRQLCSTNQSHPQTNFLHQEHLNFYESTTNIHTHDNLF